MFEKRIEKLDELKPVSITWKGQSVQIDNFEKINQLMSQAVEDDLKNVQEVPGGWNNMRAEATQVEQLKKAIFIAYINDTDDFKESIYNEKAQVKKYTVSFDKNATDATGTMAAQEFEHGKEQVLSKNQFERIGYDFIGWKDINGNIYTDQQMVNNLVAENDGQITLFAQWKPIEYQVKFHKNHSNAVGTMENQKMVYDQSYQLNEFTLDGYEFKGWATSPNGQVVYKDEEIVTKLTDKSNHIIDLYSIWEKKPTPQPPAVNKAPVIVATDKVLTVGDSFDPLKDVTADDPEDGQIIIKSEHVIKNEVNTKVPGKYEVIYRVADKEGLATEKTIIVVVNPKITGINHVPVINAIDKVLTVGDKFDPLDGVTAFDEEDKDITLTQANIIANNVDTSVAGTYNVTYKVTDKDGASTVKTITVTVKAKDIVDKPDDDTSKPDVPNDGTSKPNKPNINPQTGDVASVGLLQSIIVGSTSILALLLGNRKKRKR